VEAKKPYFVIAQIGPTGSPERHRSDKMMRHVIEPAVAECGYEAKRAHEIDEL
jgi:hypothetical protein